MTIKRPQLRPVATTPDPRAPLTVTAALKTKPPRRRPKDRYMLRLFVAGASDRSREAVLHVRRLCDGEPKGRYHLEVIDIYQQPALARASHIVATPTLIRQFPLPTRRFIGNLVNLTRLFAEQELPPDHGPSR